MKLSSFAKKSYGRVAGLLLTGFVFISVTKAKEEGWESLFNGKNLDGWHKVLRGKNPGEDPNNLIQVHDGMVHMYKDATNGSNQPFGYICTNREYENYHLRFQYKWGTKKFAPRADPKSSRDAGVLYHVVGNEEVWPKSVECQVQEEDVGDIFTVYTRITTFVDPKTTNVISTVSTNETTGEIKTNKMARPVFLPEEQGGVIFTTGVPGSIRRVKKSLFNEHDGWNMVEVIVRGNSAIHIINGKTNNVANNIQQSIKGEWVSLSRGRITLQCEGAEVFYKDVVIKPLLPLEK